MSDKLKLEPQTYLELRTRRIVTIAEDMKFVRSCMRARPPGSIHTFTQLYDPHDSVNFPWMKREIDVRTADVVSYYPVKSEPNTG